MAGLFYYREVNGLFIKISFFLILFIQYTGLIYTVRFTRSVKTIVLYLLSFFLIFGFIAQFLNLVVYITGDYASFSFFNSQIVLSDSNLTDIVASGIVFSLFTIPFYLKGHTLNYYSNRKYHWIIYLLAVIYLSGFIFVFNPLLVFSSFPETFQFAGLDIIKNNYPSYLIGIAVALLIYFALPDKSRWFLLVLALIATISGLFHSTLLPVDLGTLQEGKFEKQDVLGLSSFLYFIEGIALIGFTYGIYWAMRKQYYRQIILGLVFLNLLLVSNSFYDVIKSGNFLVNKSVIKSSEFSIRFSRTEKNVLYIIPDMFQGWAINRMINENPQLKEQLSGFTWYPNTLAVSRVTNTSIAPMLGGHSYAPDSLDLDTEHTVREKVSAVHKELSDKVRKKGLTFTSNRLPYSIQDEDSYDTFIPIWNPDWDAYSEDLNIGATEETDYTMLWNNALFYSVPIIFKAKGSVLV